MTPDELQQTRHRLGMTVQEFADALNTPRGTVAHWLAGTRRVPGMIDIVLEHVMWRIKNDEDK